MDKLDIAVLRQLFQGPPTVPTRVEVTLSQRKIAKRLHVSEETVRTRVNRLVKSGFIRGWMPHPNPKLLGLKVGYAVVDADAGANERAVKQFQLLVNAIIVVDYHGPAIGTVFLYPDEKALKARLALLQSLAGGPVYVSGEILYPPCDLELSPTDWKLIATMQRKPASSFAEIGKAAGVSGRTVRRRVARMSGAGALFHLPSGDETKLKHTVRADLIIKWDRRADRAKVQAGLLSILEDYYFFIGFEERFAFFNLLVPSTATADGLLRSAAALEGVQDARMEFAVGRHETYDVFLDLVSRKLAELEAR